MNLEDRIKKILVASVVLVEARSDLIDHALGCSECDTSGTMCGSPKYECDTGKSLRTKHSLAIVNLKHHVLGLPAPVYSVLKVEAKDYEL